MLWFLFYVSILLGVWGFYLFRNDKNQPPQPEQMAAEPEVQESSFDRIRRMRELAVAEKPQYLMAREQATLTIPSHLIDSIQSDVVNMTSRAVAFMNRDRDRYIWLAMTMVVIVMFIQAAYRQAETAAPVDMVDEHSWSQLQPLKTKPLYDEDVAKQVESKDAFKIIFKDFPQDKPRFIHEFTSVLSRGEEAQRDKWQEMYLTAEIYHLHKYIGAASDEAVIKYATARFEVLKAMFASNQQACQEFITSPRDYYAKARGVVGRDNFAEMIKTIPALIVASRQSPQALPLASRAEEVKRVVNNRIQDNRYGFASGNSECGRQLAYYDEVLRLPPVEASLVLRYDASHR